MTKVVGPLFSFIASGKLGNTVVYVCGQFTRSVPTQSRNPSTEAQLAQEAKFKAGVEVWNSLGDSQNYWNKFYKWLVSEAGCDIKETDLLNGYNAFMSMYLSYGVKGWDNYPLPPRILSE